MYNKHVGLTSIMEEDFTLFWSLAQYVRKVNNKKNGGKSSYENMDGCQFVDLIMTEFKNHMTC